MILFFSGTGNSRYVAERLGALLDDGVKDLFALIRGEETGPVASGRTLVIVSPTYAWRLPRVLSACLAGTAFPDAKEAYFVMTCGSDIGAAGRYNARLCRDMGLACKGTAAVKMPENYIAMFTAPGRQEAEKIVDSAEPVLRQIAGKIRAGETLTAPRAAFDALKSGPVNRFFYAASVKDRKFTVSEACTGCGLCVRHCPVNNIVLRAGRPVWQGKCTHCMACICRCPAAAIEYGKKSVGQPRYTCPR